MNKSRESKDAGHGAHGRQCGPEHNFAGVARQQHCGGNAVGAHSRSTSSCMGSSRYGSGKRQAIVQSAGKRRSCECREKKRGRRCRVSHSVRSASNVIVGLTALSRRKTVAAQRRLSLDRGPIFRCDGEHPRIRHFLDRMVYPRQIDHGVCIAKALWRNHLTQPAIPEPETYPNATRQPR